MIQLTIFMSFVLPEIIQITNCKFLFFSFLNFVKKPEYVRETRDNTIDLIHMFRDYLHYHLKCSKAYIHSR